MPLSAIILLIIPFIAGVLAFFVPKRISAIIALFGSLLTFLYFLYLLVNYNVRHELVYNYATTWVKEIHAVFHIGIDGFSVIPLMLTQLIFLFSLLYALMDTERKNSAYFALILFAQFALNGFFTSQNPITFYIFFEVALIPIYFLVLKWGGEERRQVVFKFFIYTIFGSLLLLASIIFIYHAVGANQLLTWKELYFQQFPKETQLYLLIAFIIAFGIKSPLFPFHTWQADLYQNADKPTVIILAALMSKMGVFGLLRFCYPVMPLINYYQPTVIGLCIIGVLYGALMAWKQTDMNRLLAFSSLSHMGLIAASILVCNVQSIEGAMFQIFVHGLCVAGLFTVVGVLESRSQSSTLGYVRGIASVHPRLATYFFIITLASIGLPLTAGFIGEFYMLYGLSKNELWYAAVAGISVILGAVYMFRFFQISMFGEIKNKPSIKLHIHEEYIFIIIALLLIVFGFFPRLWIDFAGFSFLEYQEYLPK